MLKPLRCDFLTGPLTDGASMDTLKHSLEQQSASIHEMLYYKKNGTGIWMEVTLRVNFLTLPSICQLQIELIPVRNETNVVVLFICTFKDITQFKVRDTPSLVGDSLLTGSFLQRQHVLWSVQVCQDSLDPDEVSFGLDNISLTNVCPIRSKNAALNKQSSLQESERDRERVSPSIYVSKCLQ